LAKKKKKVLKKKVKKKRPAGETFDTTGVAEKLAELDNDTLIKRSKKKKKKKKKKVRRDTMQEANVKKLTAAIDTVKRAKKKKKKKVRHPETGDGLQMKELPNAGGKGNHLAQGRMAGLLTVFSHYRTNLYCNLRSLRDGYPDGHGLEERKLLAKIFQRLVQSEHEWVNQLMKIYPNTKLSPDQEYNFGEKRAKVPLGFIRRSES